MKILKFIPSFDSPEGKKYLRRLRRAWLNRFPWLRHKPVGIIELCTPEEFDEYMKNFREDEPITVALPPVKGYRMLNNQDGTSGYIAYDVTTGKELYKVSANKEDGKITVEEYEVE